MICVSDSPDVVAVVEGGLLPGLRDGQLIVDHSTISPAVTRTLADRVAAKGVGWIDAPVSGGSEGAVKGTLSTMVGGSTEDLERVRPLPRDLLDHHHPRRAGRFGPTGQAGQSDPGRRQPDGGLGGVPLCRSEPVSTSKRPSNAVKGGAAGSWMLANRGPQMIADDWRPGFTIDLQQKDLRLVLDAADDYGTPLPATGLIFQLYRALQASGHGQ